MKNTKLISGLTAFLIASSSAAVYADAENTDILDLICTRSTAIEETDIDQNKITVEYLNSIASIIAKEVKTQAQEIEIRGSGISRSFYSYEDAKDIGSVNQEEQKMVKQLDSIAKYHGVEKWAVYIMNDDYEASCITGDAVLQRTGAYPASVPRNLNIPFSNALAEKASEYYYDWKKDFGDYLSSDPSVAGLSDFSANVIISERDRITEKIFNALQSIAQDYETSGLKIENGKISSSDNSEIVNEILLFYPEYSKIKWYADISDYVVNGVIAEDPRTGFTSAYPHTVPANMNIPYAEGLIDYASNYKTDWITDFADCLTTDPEQIKFAEIEKKSTTARLNLYAEKLYTNAQTLIQEYETRGLIVEFDGTSENDELQSDFISDLSEYMPPDIYNKDLSWNIIAHNGFVEGITVSSSDCTGAYPNNIPENMRIPFSNEILQYSSGFPEIWKEKYSDHILETVELEYPPYSLNWTNKAHINSCNSNAKSLFVNAQTLIQEIEAKGELLPSDVITSDDDTALVKEIKSQISGRNDSKWAVYVKDYVVVGTVYSISSNFKDMGYQSYDTEKDKFIFTSYLAEEKSYTGSYPVAVPDDKIINYDHSLVKKYYSDNINLTWNNTDASDHQETDKTDEQPDEDPSKFS